MDVLDPPIGPESERAALGRHAVLLASLVALLVALPILERAPGSDLRFPLLLLLVLFAAIHVNRPRRRVVSAAALVGGAAIVGIATAHAIGSWLARATGEALGLVLLGITTYQLLVSLARARRVDLDTVIGGICVYLLIGVSFALMYRLLIDLVPDAIVTSGLPLGEVSGDASALSARLVYFSFITLSTVGFGDITPRDGIAQMLSAAEAVIGQLYLAIFIARLMGLYMASTQTAPPGNRPGA
jgi:hypothetical protein